MLSRKDNITKRRQTRQREGDKQDNLKQDKWGRYGGCWGYFGATKWGCS